MRIKNIQANGKIISKMDLVLKYGMKLKVNINIYLIDILVNGKMEKEMDMVYFFIVMEQNMKEHGKIIIKMVLVFLHIMMEENILDYLRVIIFVVMNRIKCLKVLY